VAGRPELLSRLIGNLLDNAERYADNRGACFRAQIPKHHETPPKSSTDRE